MAQPILALAAADAGGGDGEHGGHAVPDSAGARLSGQVGDGPRHVERSRRRAPNIARPKMPSRLKLLAVIGGGAFVLSSLACLGICLLSLLGGAHRKEERHVAHQGC